MVDHLHLMETSDLKLDETHAIARNVSELRKLAKELNIPVLCLAQLSRSCENRQDKRPLLSDLRQTGKIEEDAYGIIFVYRDEYYNPDTTLDPGVAEMNVAKNRDGETSLIKVYFQESAPAFRSLQREEIQI